MSRQASRQDWIEDRNRPGGIGRAELRPEGGWEGIRLAAVTMLTVIVFGLGWVSLELELAEELNGAGNGTRYDWGNRGPVDGATLVAHAANAGGAGAE